MLVVSVGNVGDGKQFLQAVQMLVISVGNVGNGNQFSANSTDGNYLC